jgi:DNA-binding transcriptional LysR family regulator
MDINLQKYLSFIKVVEYGSFTKAAEILNYTQSGISRMISDLEKEWGVSLLERGKGGVRLTGDGIKILPYARQLCTDFDRLRTQVDEINGLKSGFIRIGTISSVTTHWLPNIIKVFQKDYPYIDFEFLLGDYGEIEEWINTGRVDCGFLILPTTTRLETIFLKRDRLLAVIPENHPLAELEKFPSARLEQEPFLLLEKGGRSDVTDMLKKYGINPNVRFTLWDDYAVMSMVESGLGISVLPELILKRAPYNILIKELDVPAWRDIGFAFRDGKTASAAMKKFMEYLPHIDG